MHNRGHDQWEYSWLKRRRKELLIKIASLDKEIEDGENSFFVLDKTIARKKQKREVAKVSVAFLEGKKNLAALEEAEKNNPLYQDGWFEKTSGLVLSIKKMSAHVIWGQTTLLGELWSSYTGSNPSFSAILQHGDVLQHIPMNEHV